MWYVLNISLNETPVMKDAGTLIPAFFAFSKSIYGRICRSERETMRIKRSGGLVEGEKGSNLDLYSLASRVSRKATHDDDTKLVYYSMYFYDNLYGLVCEEYDRRSRVVRSTSRDCSIGRRHIAIQYNSPQLLVYRFFFLSLLPPVCIYFVVQRNPGSFAWFLMV